MPASPVDPPTTPLQKPAPAPASAAALDLRQSGPHEIVEAEENEQDADRNAKMRWRYPSQHQYADGNADRAAGDQGDEPAGIERVTQLPDGVSLHEQSVSNDERRGLDRRQRMQPDGGCNQAEGEAGEPGYQGCGKGAYYEYGEIERSEDVHVRFILKLAFEPFISIVVLALQLAERALSLSTVAPPCRPAPAQSATRGTG